MSIDKALEHMRERDEQDIKNEQTQLDKVYADLPRLIERASNLTGITPEQLVHIAAQTVFTHANLKWYEVISVIDTAYTHKKRLFGTSEE